MALNYKRYQVKPDENLLGIAQAQGLEYNDLLNVNPGLQWVNTGQEINLPRQSKAGPNAPGIGGLPPDERPPLAPGVLAGGHGGRVGGYVYPGGVINAAGGLGNLITQGGGSLIGNANQQQVGGSAFTGTPGQKYTTRSGSTYMITQADKETGIVTAERRVANYGVRGDKWRTYTTQDAEGNWRRVTYRAYGGGGREKGPMKQARIEAQRAARAAKKNNVEIRNQPVLQQVMGLRAATG